MTEFQQVMALVVVHLLTAVVSGLATYWTERTEKNYYEKKMGVLYKGEMMNKTTIVMISLMPIVNLIMGGVAFYVALEYKSEIKELKKGIVARKYVEYVLGKMPEQKKERYTEMKDILIESKGALKGRMIAESAIDKYEKELEQIVLVIENMISQENIYTKEIYDEIEPFLDELQKEIVKTNSEIDGVENQLDYKQYLEQKEQLRNITKRTPNKTNNKHLKIV